MNFHKLVAVAVFLGILATGLFGGAQIAQAASIDELLARIAQLRAQIQELQKQLQTQSETTTAWCHTFNTNLRIGDVGEEVTALQLALQKEGLIDEEISSNEFEEKVASAVVGFQEKYKNDILAPYRLARGTGFVGKSTRAKLNALYGCTVGEPAVGLPPTGPVKDPGSILPPTTPVSFRLGIFALSPSSGPIGTKVTITGNGFTKTGNRIKFGNLGSENDPSYSVNSTDGSTLVFTVPSGNYVSCWYTNPRCMLPVNATPPGAHEVSVMNANGSSNAVTFTVTEKTANQPFITVLFPNGGEEWVIGGSYYVYWKSPQPLSKVNIDLENWAGQPAGGPLTWRLAANIVPMPFIGPMPAIIGGEPTGYKDTYQYAIQLAENITPRIQSGDQYKIRITDASDSSPYSQQRVDSSDGYFTIAAASTAAPSFTVLSPNGGEHFVAGQTYNLTWKFSGSTDKIVQIELGLPSSDGPVLTNVGASLQKYSWTVPSTIAPRNDYRIIIREVAPLYTLLDSSDSFFEIVSNSSPSIGVTVSVNGSNAPASVAYDSPFTVSWTSTGAVSCGAFGEFIPLVGGGLWTDLDNLPISGSKTLYARHNTLGYRSSMLIGMSCFDNARNSNTGSVNLSVNAPAVAAKPSVDLKVNASDGPVTLMKGGNAGLIAWEAKGVDSCAASLGGSYDLNGDGYVNINDTTLYVSKNPGATAETDFLLKEITRAFGTLGGSYDVNGDGLITGLDISLFSHLNPLATAANSPFLAGIIKAYGTVWKSGNINSDTNLSWNGKQDLSGNASTGALGAGQTLVLSCSGSQGSVMDSVGVIVK